MIRTSVAIGIVFLVAGINVGHAQKVTPYQSSTEKAGAEQKNTADAWDAKYRKDAEARLAGKKKLAECKLQAKDKKFNIHLLKRASFIKQCMAG